MKRILFLLTVALMILSLCACGGNGAENAEKSKNEVELTMENYENYLNISSSRLFTGKFWRIQPSDSPNSIGCNSQAECKIDVKSASSNYDYKDVTLTMKITAIYDTYEGFEKTNDVVSVEEITVKCDVGGNGTNRVVIFEGIPQKYQIAEDSLGIEWEVVSVSGSVDRVK